MTTKNDTDRARYSRLARRVIAVTGWSPARFNDEARHLGTQDGEGEPPTAYEYLMGALELAHERGLDLA